MNDARLDELNKLARRLQGYTARQIEPYAPALEEAIAELMEATFQETDLDRKPRLAAVELKLRLMRERVVVNMRN